jgi:hypothetical protein
LLIQLFQEFFLNLSALFFEVFEALLPLLLLLFGLVAIALIRYRFGHIAQNRWLLNGLVIGVTLFLFPRLLYNIKVAADG